MRTYVHTYIYMHVCLTAEGRQRFAIAGHNCTYLEQLVAMTYTHTYGCMYACMYKQTIAIQKPMTRMIVKTDTESFLEFIGK